MLRSLYSGVSGLMAHQTKMDVIGNNIANVNTYGFKGSRVTFRDIYYQTQKNAAAGNTVSGGINPSQVGYGVSVASIDKIMSRSSFQSTASALDIAIAGEGFFQVQDKAGNRFYTRAGMFNVDNAGNLVDTNGKFILGTVNSDPTNSAGLSPKAGSSKIQIIVPDAYSNPSADVTVTAGNTTIIDSSKAKLTIGYSAGGSDKPGSITVTVGSDNSSSATIDENGNLNVVLPKNAVIGTPQQLATAINNAIDKGRETLKPGTGVGNVPAEYEINDDNYKGGQVVISYDLTQVQGKGSSLSDAEIKQLNKDLVDSILNAGQINLNSNLEPQTFGNLSSFSIGPDGVLTGMHPYHGLLTFGRIDLVTFDNPLGLEESGNTYFAETVSSGKAKTAAPGFDGSGELQTSALEMSNVSLAQEFSDMIITQRGFQANSRIITTSDTMLEELVNLKR